MALYGIVFLGSTPIGAPIVGVVGGADRRTRRRSCSRAAFAIAVGAVVLARGWRTGRLAGSEAVAADPELPVGAADAELPVAASG